MDYERFKTTIETLKEFKIEKLCVLGNEAKEDIKLIQRVINDIENFYEGELE